MPKTIHTENSAETENIGKKLANMLLEDSSLPHFIALYGDLGVGKTAFVRGLASVLTPNATVKSPTFAIVNEYRGDGRKLYHFDMYRIYDEDDLYSTGFYDYLAEKNAVSVTEWSEKIPYALPDSYFKVNIEKDNLEIPDSRVITVELI